MSTDKKVEDMTSEELADYEANLDKEIKVRDLKAKQVTLDEAKVEEKKKAEDDVLEEQKTIALESIYKEHPEWAPVEKIPDNSEAKDDDSDAGKITKYYNSYWERNDDMETLSSNSATKLEDIQKYSFQCFKNGKYGAVGMDEMFVNTDSDTGCEDIVDAWSPADTYAKIIWETFVCTADLFKIAVKGIAINPGDGLGVQIRAYGAFQAPSALAACNCASCASITFKTYPITLSQYNLEAIVCNLDLYDVGNILMDAYLKAMGNSWAQYFDAQIYAALTGATPGTTATLPSALNCTPSIQSSCCTDGSLVNLYNAVHQIVASMREGLGLAGPYNPDWVIVSPTVAAIFKRMQTPTPMPWMGDLSFDSDGVLKKWGSLKVIEFCGATSCCTTSDAVVAVIVDSRRAVGAIFGQRPKLYKFFQSNCNSWRLDQWAYFGVAALDLDAIAHVVNP